MKSHYIEITVNGETRKVPSHCIDGRMVIITGKCLRVAAVHDENWQEGEVVQDPSRFIAKLKEEKTSADIFTFAQKLPEVTPKYNYDMEWDNVAAIPITTFADWFEKRAEYDVRKAVRRANKLGVVVKSVEFTDELVRGIQAIYNECPMRQGRYFWHYGKSFQKVKKENSTYLDRGEFIGAYYQGELIGFIRLVYVGEIASTLQVVAMAKHFNKKPVNALIAKAVEICSARRSSYLVYDKFIYGNRTDSPLTEFKRRNGFEHIRFPRYYIPLTLKGRVATRLKLHRGLSGLLPSRLITLLVGLRATFLEKALLHRRWKAPEKHDIGAAETSECN